MKKKPTYEEPESGPNHRELNLGKSATGPIELSDTLSEDFKRLAEHSRDVIYHYDIISHEFLFFNRIGTEYGYGDKKSTLLLIHPDDRQKVRSASKESLADGCHTGEVEYRICPTDGSIRWMHDRWIVIRNASGKPLAIEGVIRDNTHRKLTEQALEDSRERYRVLVETMNEGLAVIDANYVLTYLNDKLCEMLGYKKEELLGNLITDYFDWAQHKTWLNQMSKRKKGVGDHYELSWTRKDGGKIHTIVSAQPILDATGNFAGSFGVITDISKQKEVERVLKEREKELESKTNYLEELNAALKVLLKRREEDKRELEQHVVSNVKELVMPYVKKLGDGRLEEKQKAMLSILTSNLKEIVSPFLSRVSMSLLNLTPTETQVANFVKQGKTTKEIAEFLGLSPRTIESHRENIRKKLGIKNKKSNLRTHLLSFQTKGNNPEILSVF